MKKISAIFTVALLALSCNDGFLDKTPLDKLSEEAVFNSAALAENYINAIYTVLPDPFQEGNIGCITDEGYFRYGGSSTRYIASGTMTPDNIMYMNEGGPAHSTRTTILNIWNRTYERIYRINYFLTYVDEKGTKIAQEDLTRLKGEAYFLRAWAYFNLIQRYAGVPIVTKPYNLTDVYDAQRDNFDDCVDFILEDLDTAYSLLPSKENALKGRINKDVVLALRSRLTLVAASPLFNDPDRPEGGIFRGTYSADKWKRALDATKQIIDRADVDGAYSLDKTYDGMWKNTSSPELIWAKFFIANSDASDNSMKKAQLLYSIPYFNGWTAFEPTQAMFIDYEMANGKKIFEDGSGYNPQKPFDGRDPRFYQSVAYHGGDYPNTDPNKGYQNNTLDLALHYDGVQKGDFEKGKTEPNYTSKSKHLWSSTGAMGLEMMKWYIPTSPITESETGSLLYPWFRLAEMYLNYAECAYMTGDETLCRQYINKIRARAGMPEVSEGGEGLWDRVVNERRVELAFETFRYFDVRRWKTAPFYENVPIIAMRTMILEENGTAKETIYRVARTYDERLNNTCYYWLNSKERTDYINSNGRDIFEQANIDSEGAVQVQGSCIKYRWLGKDYWVDYGDCCLNIPPTQKHFYKKDGEWANYLMPIPANEMTKSNGTLVQNPGY